MEKNSIIVILLILPILIFGQTNGKIKGKVTNEKTGEPIVGANVVVKGGSYDQGAVSDKQGYYVILDVTPGTYTLEFSYIGMKEVTVTDVKVTSGHTKTVNIEMSESSIEGEAVEIVAEQELVETDATSSSSRIMAESISELPTRGLDNLVANSAGVVSVNDELHFRGGRESEVGYYVNGVSTRNPVNNENVVHIIQEAIQETNIQTGGYKASQGAANSGIVSTQLKTGSQEFHGLVEYRTDQFVDPKSGKTFLNTHSYGQNNIVGTFSGPLFKDKATFFIAGEYTDLQDYEKRFSEGFEFENLVDQNPNTAKNLRDTVDLTYPDGFTPNRSSTRYTINGKVTFDLPVRLSFSTLYSHSEQEVSAIVNGRQIADNDPMVSVNDRIPYNVYDYGVFTAQATKQLSNRSYIEVKVSRLIDEQEQHDGWMGNDWNQWYDSTAVDDYLYSHYDSSSSRLQNSRYESRWRPRKNYVLQGFPVERNGNPRYWYGKTSMKGWEYSVDFKTQLGQHHEISTGLNYRSYTYRQYDMHPQVMSEMKESFTSYKDIPVDDWFNTGSVNAIGYDRFGNEIDKKKKYTYGKPDTIAGVSAAPKRPKEFSAFLQDKIEYDDIVINAGLRLDYFDPDDKKLRDPGDPIYYEASSFIKDKSWKDIDPYITLTPRLGFSFPTGPSSNFFLYYGKFVQMPQYSSIYNSPHDYKQQIVDQRYFFSTPVGFGLEPTHTTQYEVGFNKAFSNIFSVGINAYYKNQKGLIKSTLQEPSKNSSLSGSYIRYGNGDFATTKGIEFRLNLRRINRISGSFNYTYTDAEGTASNETTYHTAIFQGSPVPKVVNPLNYSVTHEGALNIDYRFGENDGGPILSNSGANLLFTFTSGHPYTRIDIESWGQANAYEKGVNYFDDSRNRIATEPFGASVTPWTYNVDIKLHKSFKIGSFTSTVFVNINNLLNTKNVLNVYPLTGQAQNDGLISNPEQVEKFKDSYGEKWEKMYRAINITNGQAYWDKTEGDELFSTPRQIKAGIRINF